MATPSPSTPRVSPCVFPPHPNGCHCGHGLWVSPRPCASRWPCPLGHHRSRGPIPRASHHGFVLVGITMAICLSHTLLWLCPHGHRCGCDPHMHLAMAVALTHLPVAMSLWASLCPCPLRSPHCGCVSRGPCPSHVPRTHLAMSVSPWASLWPCSSPWLCPHRLLCSPVPMSCAAAMSPLRHPHVCDPPCLVTAPVSLAAASSSAHFTTAMSCTRTTAVVALVGIVTSTSRHMPRHSHVLASLLQSPQAAQL